MDEIVRRLRAAGCVFAEDEARLIVSSGAADLESLVARRVAGEPLEHLLGWADFAGLSVAVADGVFVPRRRTEFLARTAIGLARTSGPRPVVLDLCCGSGAIAALIDRELDDVELHAAELDPAAVACARRTLPERVPVHEGDLFAPVPPSLRGRLDVVVANVPYVPTGAVAFMPPEAREHERRAALDGGPDGLDLVRRVAAAAPGWLAPGGHLLVETGAEQAAAAADVYTDAGLDPRVRTSEEFAATVVVGRRRL